MKDQDILYQLLRAGAQQLKAAWKKAYFRSDQKIIKCCYLLRIPHLWQVVRTLRQDIALGRGNVEKNKQSEHALYNTLQQKQKAFDQFMMVIALQHGWGHTIARIKNIQNHFMTSANMVLHKIKKLKHAAYAGDVQRVCKLLQTEYLLDFQLKEILNDWQVTNKVVIDIMEKRLHLQSNKTLKSKDIETIFSDYVKEQMVIQSSNSKNDLEGALLT